MTVPILGGGGSRRPIGSFVLDRTFLVAFVNDRAWSDAVIALGSNERPLSQSEFLKEDIPDRRTCPPQFSSGDVSRPLPRQILTKAVELVHSFVKDCDDSNRAIGEHPPVNIMMLMTTVEAIHSKLGRNGTPGDLAHRDFLESFE